MWVTSMAQSQQSQNATKVAFGDMGKIDMKHTTWNIT